MSEMAPFDLDAARARRIETSGQSLEFVFGGETFAIPPTAEWDLTVPETMAEGRILDAFRILLGDEQFERFRSHGPHVADAEAIAEWLSASATGSSGN